MEDIEEAQHAKCLVSSAISLHPPSTGKNTLVATLAFASLGTADGVIACYHSAGDAYA